MPFQIGSETVRSLVAAGAILFQAFHDDPVEVAADEGEGFLYLQQPA
jgi:hypothetical protein